MASDPDSTNRWLIFTPELTADTGVGAEESEPAVVEPVPAQGAAEVRPEKSAPPDKPDEPAPSTSDALERDTEKTPAVNAPTSEAETASTPNTETTPTAGGGPVNVGWVDPAITYAITEQLSSRRQSIGRALTQMAARQAMAIPPARGPAILAAWGPVLKGAPALAEWSEDQILAWIISRRETKLTPEMPPKIEWARQELTKAVTKELNKMLAQSVAIDHAVLQGQAPHGLNEGVFRISGLRSGALAHFLRIGWLTPETIKWDDITGDPEGVKRLWPARETNTLADRQLYAEDGSEPAAHAKESMPEPASPVESEPALPTEPPHVELALVSSAPEVESRTPLPTTPPDEPTLDQVESDASDNSARPPSVEKLKAFVATYIKDTKASGKVPTKQGLCDAARDALPGATRKRLHDEYEKQTPTLSPGRPRKEHK